MVEPKGADIRRIEVITGVGRRRTFSEEEKSRVVEETLRPGAAPPSFMLYDIRDSVRLY
jgi:transposase-like protein